MVSKWLDVKVAIDVNAAKTALNWLIGSVKELDNAFKSMKTWITNTGWVANTSARNFSTLWNAAKNAWNTMKTAFSGVRWTINWIWSSVFWLWRQFMWFMSIIWWIGLIWSIKNLQSFSKEFWLLQASAYITDTVGTNILKKWVFNISNRTGEDVESVVKSTTQIFGAWLQPTAPVGTEEYKKQISDVIKMQDVVSKFALWTWTTSEEAWTAIIKYMNSFKMDVHDIDNWTTAANVFSQTLDQWLWVMNEYINQFWKFGATGMAAWRWPWETASVFSVFSKFMTPDDAWNQTRMLWQFFWQQVKQAFSFENQMKRVKKEAMENFKITPEDQKRIQSMTVADFANISFDKKTGKQRDPLWILTTFRETTAWMWTMAIQTFVSAYSWWKVTIANALRNLLPESTYKDLIRIQAKMGEINWLQTKKKSGEITDKEYNKEMDLISRKYAIMTETFDTKWKRFIGWMRNSITQVSDAVAPAIWVLLESASWFMTWIDFNTAESVIASFKTAREQIEALDISPAFKSWLNWVVDKIEEFHTFMSSDEWKYYFEGLILKLLFYYGLLI